MLTTILQACVCMSTTANPILYTYSLNNEFLNDSCKQAIAHQCTSSFWKFVDIWNIHPLLYTEYVLSVFCYFLILKKPGVLLNNVFLKPKYWYINDMSKKAAVYCLATNSWLISHYHLIHICKRVFKFILFTVGPFSMHGLPYLNWLISDIGCKYDLLLPSSWYYAYFDTKVSELECGN